MDNLDYTPSGETVRQFHLDDASFRVLMGPFGCVGPETLVSTPNGLLPMQCIRAGDRVTSWNKDTGSFQYSISSGSFLKGYARLYVVETSRGHWRAKGNHRTMLHTGQYANVDALRPGDALLSLNGPTTVVSVAYEADKSEYWDMAVGDTNNYVLSDGTVQHNSGKTTACNMEFMLRAIATPPDHQGVRRSRGAVIRNRISDLEGTTVKSWNEMFESMFGAVRGTPTGGGFVHTWNFGLPDGSKVESEARFFPYDSQRDVKRLLGAEYTFAFLNEMRELPASLMTILPGRLRYPNIASLADGQVPWFGVFGDTNAPDSGHWLHKAFEGGKDRDGWKMFRQPPGVIKQNGKWKPNPDADNVCNLPRTYYADAVAGQPEDVILVNYGNEYGYIKNGKRIIPSFTDHMHVAREMLYVDDDIEVVYVGIDFGSTPAAVVTQETANGRWLALQEIMSEDKPGIRQFAKDVLLPFKREMEALGHTVVWTGDPAGKGTSQTDGDDCFAVLASLGIDCEPAYTNAIGHRAEVVDSLCRELVDGEPRFQISPNCTILIKALAQKYVYAALNKAEDERDIRYANTPKKDGNAWSHLADGLQYSIMGSKYGEDFTQADSTQKTGPIAYKRRNAA